jgi:glutathione reductase (NADPH)
VIRGCVPKKLLVYASRFAEEFEDAAGYGWNVGAPTFNWSHLIANKDREIARLEAAYMTTLERYKVQVVKSRAVLEVAQRICLLATGETIRPRHILIATGTGAVPDRNPGHRARHFLKWGVLPRRVARASDQGGGYIAVEFAGIFSGLGAEVTLVYRAEHLARLR